MKVVCPTHEVAHEKGTPCPWCPVEADTIPAPCGTEHTVTRVLAQWCEDTSVHAIPSRSLAVDLNHTYGRSTHLKPEERWEATTIFEALHKHICGPKESIEQALATAPAVTATSVAPLFWATGEHAVARELGGDYVTLLQKVSPEWCRPSQGVANIRAQRTLSLLKKLGGLS